MNPRVKPPGRITKARRGSSPAGLGTAAANDATRFDSRIFRTKNFDYRAWCSGRVKPTRRHTKARRIRKLQALALLLRGDGNASAAVSEVLLYGSASIIAPGREGSQLPALTHQGPQGYRRRAGPGSTQTANGGGEGQPLAARTSPTATAMVGYRIPARHPICLAESTRVSCRCRNE